MADQQQPLIPEVVMPRGRQLPPSNGRPKGAANRKLDLLRDVANHYRVDLVERCIAEALAGDPLFMKLILDRIWPKPRTAPVAVELPPTQTPDELRRAMHELLARTAAGELSPDDGAAFLGMMRDIVAAHSVDAVSGKPAAGPAADPRGALMTRITRLIEQRRQANADSDNDD